MGHALNIVKKFYEATDPHGRKSDDLLPRIADFLAPDLKFSGPLMTSSGADAYLEIQRQFLPFHAGYKFIRHFEDGDDVCSIYELSVKTPGGGTLNVPMVDWVRISNGRIKEQIIYYDPREFAKEFNMPDSR
jgi:hypothetical protein